METTAAKPLMTCDVVMRCEDAGEDTLNVALCRSGLDDPGCGTLYAAVLECSYATCPPLPKWDDDGGPGPCEAQWHAWGQCRMAGVLDAHAQ